MTRCSASFFSLLSKFPALDALRPAERFRLRRHINAQASKTDGL